MYHLAKFQIHSLSDVGDIKSGPLIFFVAGLHASQTPPESEISTCSRQRIDPRGGSMGGGGVSEEFFGNQFSEFPIPGS